jgi:hypothetical protein
MAKNTIDFSPTNPENAAAGAPQEEPIEETQELEVKVGPEEEKKPDVVTLTPEEFATLKASSDSARAVKEGIEGLAAKMQGTTQVVQAPPANAPQQTAEEFFAEHSDDIFDKEKGPALMRKFMKLASEQEYGGMLRGMSSALANTKKELLESRDPQFKRYKAEVEALVAQQPPEVQVQPDVYDRAWLTVRQRHASELEAEAVKSQVDAAVEAKLKELGIDPAKLASGERPPAHVQSAARSTPAVTTAGKRTVRLPDEKTQAALRAEATRRGLDFEDLLRTKGYL